MNQSYRQHISTLGLDANPNLETIRRAYRRKAFQYHPDRNNSPLANQEFVRMSRAYEFLISNYERYSSAPEVVDLFQAEADQYQEFERNREQSWQEAMDRARHNYDQFRTRNANYRQRWYYIPVKILAYFIFAAIILAGLTLMIGPLIFLIFSKSIILIILYVPILLLGGLVIYYAFVYKIRIDPYFY